MTAKKQLLPTSKHQLLFVVATVWGWAGCSLLKKGAYMLFRYYHSNVYVFLLLCLALGLAFYRLVFQKLSLKHIRRISDLPYDRPSLFSFFSPKSYLLLAAMITLGMGIKHSGVVSYKYLCLIYLTMATPLLISAFRFLKAGFYIKKTK